MHEEQTSKRRIVPIYFVDWIHGSDGLGYLTHSHTSVWTFALSGEYPPLRKLHYVLFFPCRARSSSRCSPWWWFRFLHSYVCILFRMNNSWNNTWMLRLVPNDNRTLLSCSSLSNGKVWIPIELYTLFPDPLDSNVSSFSNSLEFFITAGTHSEWTCSCRY